MRRLKPSTGATLDGDNELMRSPKATSRVRLKPLTQEQSPETKENPPMPGERTSIHQVTPALLLHPHYDLDRKPRRNGACCLLSISLYCMLQIHCQPTEVFGLTVP